MKLYEYECYENYVAAQVAANMEKKDAVWVSRRNVSLVAFDFNQDAKEILCHGTRNGTEQKYFAELYPRGYILGTEISPSANEFENTMQWDMQQPHDALKERFDIVYSNAFDHVIYPEQTIRTWLGQLSPRGRLYIDHASDPAVNYMSKTDPLEISDGEMTKLITDIAGSKFELRGHIVGSSCKNHSTLIHVIGRC